MLLGVPFCAIQCTYCLPVCLSLPVLFSAYFVPSFVSLSAGCGSLHRNRCRCLFTSGQPLGLNPVLTRGTGGSFVPFLCSRRGPGTAQGLQAAPQGTFVQNRNAGDWQPLACTTQAQAWTQKPDGTSESLGSSGSSAKVESGGRGERAFPAEGMAESPKSAGSLPRPRPSSLSFLLQHINEFLPRVKRRGDAS